MAATLDRDRDTASGVSDAPHLPAAARNVRVATGERVQLSTTLMRSPDGKSQRGDDGGKGVGSSGNDEETEYKLWEYCVYRRRIGEETGHGR